MNIFDMPQMLTLENGMQIASYGLGNSGPPVIFCHGFPELAFTWRHVLPAAAQAGYRAIAIDMPGFGRSDRPNEVEKYDIAHVTQTVGLAAKAAGFDRAVFVGHDWGSSIVWEMPLLQSAVTAGVICLNTPRWKYRNWGDEPLNHLKTVHGNDHYMLHFQEPGVIDKALATEDQYDAAAAGRHRRAPFAAYPISKDSDIYHQRLQGIRGAPKGEQCLTDDEAAFYTETFRRTGFTGGLNYYRNIDRNAKILAGTSMNINVPALMLAASHDLYNPEEASLGIENLGPCFERIVVPRSGHWLPDENRADLNFLIIDWLDRNRKLLWPAK